jgi:hypothetical protein
LRLVAVVKRCCADPADISGDEAAIAASALAQMEVLSDNSRGVKRAQRSGSEIWATNEYEPRAAASRRRTIRLKFAQ